MSNNLTLIVNGKSISGWQRIRVTRGVERCPNDFDISMTEHFEGVKDVVVQPGDECQVKIGKDLVITGYIDRYIPSISRNQHMVRIAGRGKCQDLVDCSAEWENGQISGASVLGIAQKLANAYGIKVYSTGEVVGDPIPQTNLILTETPWEIIERTCRYRGLLAYELPDGNLFLTQEGTNSMASGFVQGKNVQSASIDYSADIRYQQYVASRMSVNTFKEFGDGGNTVTTVTDDGVKRNRKLALISEGGGDAGDATLIKRATWEKNRRIGRSRRLRVVVDSWRDSKGNLWEPNNFAPVSIPALKAVDNSPKWIIGDVTFRMDENGTSAELLLMPEGSFTPRPILWLPVPVDISQAIDNSPGLNK